MIDIKFIREYPKRFDAYLAKRSLAPLSEAILQLDDLVRKSKQELQQLQQQKNKLSDQFSQLKTAEDKLLLKQQVQGLNESIQVLQTSLNQLEERLNHQLVTIPNLLDDSVPTGADESSNQCIHSYGTPREFTFTPLSHDDLGVKKGWINFEASQAVSGTRFSYLMGDLVRLERALVQFILDHNTLKFGYTEVNPPLLVKSHALMGTAQLPKFEEDLFKTTTNDLWLISTSEISLTNLVRESILDKAELPLRFTAHTPCFRSEAGSAGKDTKGILRQHQFYKVELVSITTPSESMAELERMTECAESVLKSLELPFRRMLLCSGDTGFGSKKTYDLEVWVPSQNKYREISSCSVCGDFQARRMEAKFKDSATNKIDFVHTLNGSSLAIGRTLLAILENYQNQDLSVTIPEALRPYLGGRTHIG